MDTLIRLRGCHIGPTVLDKATPHFRMILSDQIKYGIRYRLESSILYRLKKILGKARNI